MPLTLIEKTICRKQFFLLKLTPFFEKSKFRKNSTMFTSFIYIFRIFLVFCSRCKIAEFSRHCQLEKKYESLKKLQRWKRQVENEVIGFFRNFDFSKNAVNFNRKNYFWKTVFSTKVLFYNIKGKNRKTYFSKIIVSIKVDAIFRKIEILKKSYDVHFIYIYFQNLSRFLF